MSDASPSSQSVPVPHEIDAHYARLREINIRLKEIAKISDKVHQEERSGLLREFFVPQSPPAMLARDCLSITYPKGVWDKDMNYILYVALSTKDFTTLDVLWDVFPAEMSRRALKEASYQGWYDVAKYVLKHPQKYINLMFPDCIKTYASLDTAHDEVFVQLLAQYIPNAQIDDVARLLAQSGRWGKLDLFFSFLPLDKQAMAYQGLFQFGRMTEELSQNPELFRAQLPYICAFKDRQEIAQEVTKTTKERPPLKM